MDGILVSICCITYNHEKYIADAIESFLMQETSFDFEIIIHDDASTDNTALIIKEYEEKYPDIIKPIYQKENQYSRGRKPLIDFVLPKAKGEYIATCEGDDFWTDHEKIQIQVEFLEKNKNYNACFHAVKVVNTDKSDTGRNLGLYGEGSQKLPIKNAGVGGVVHVSSRLVRTKFYKKKSPNWVNNAIHGDVAFALYMALEGNVFYIDKVLSAYRVGVENSMMTNLRKTNYKYNDIKLNQNIIETFKMADEYYNYKYHDEIEKSILLNYVTLSILKKHFSSSARENYRKYIKENGLGRFFKLVILKKYPIPAGYIVKLKGRFLVNMSR